jgi:hypothetical protein
VDEIVSLLTAALEEVHVKEFKSLTAKLIPGTI